MNMHLYSHHLHINVAGSWSLCNQIRIKIKRGPKERERWRGRQWGRERGKWKVKNAVTISHARLPRMYSIRQNGNKWARRTQKTTISSGINKRRQNKCQLATTTTTTMFQYKSNRLSSTCSIKYYYFQSTHFRLINRNIVYATTHKHTIYIQNVCCLNLARWS